MFRNLIFDWSGTLCDDLALTLEATNYVLGVYGRPPLSREQYRREFQLPYPDYYAWKVPEASLPELEDHYRRAFDSSAASVHALPYAHAFMEFCRRRGIRCFALTSMDSKAFEAQARDLGFYDYYEYIHSGIHNKEEYIPTVMHRHALNPSETAFIGDMQHDMNAAHVVGITGIAVLTGYNNAEQLVQAKPDLIIPHLGALQQIWERTPSPLRESIGINAMELSCRIGVPEEERSERQRISADIRVVPRNSFQNMGEDISNTIDYFALSQRLTTLAQDSPWILLETLAHAMAECCVREFGATEATVELKKFILPNIGSTAVVTTSRA